MVIPSPGQAVVVAESNWWGHASGPSGEGPGSGDGVTPGVLFDPWKTSGDCGTIPTGIRDDLPPPPATAIHPPYPNPFNPTVAIRFELVRGQAVRLEIYDTRGALVKILVDGHIGPGYHESIWDGTGATGAPMSSGVYFYRFQTIGLRQTGKMVLLK